jgi:methylmalonyl-CoA mutase N-terminal domain/subunit
MRERFGAREADSWKLRFHTQTGGSTLTAQQPMNNVARVTVQALSAVLGGTQSLHTNSMDEALALPTEAAVQVALRTQQILAYESGVADTIDPLGGSYVVEMLTSALEQRAETYLAQIDEIGGALAAIESGFTNREISDAAYDYQRKVEKQEQIIVGVNQFTVDEDMQTDILKIDPSIEAAQRQRLADLRARRDNTKVAELRGQLEKAARGSENLMPLFIACVENDVTLGEISHTLRGVFGEYRPNVSI